MEALKSGAKIENNYNVICIVIKNGHNFIFFKF